MNVGEKILRELGYIEEDPFQEHPDGKWLAVNTSVKYVSHRVVGHLIDLFEAEDARIERHNGFIRILLEFELEEKDEEEVQEDEERECPYCGDSFGKKGIGSHKARCPENPDRIDTLNNEEKEQEEDVSEDPEEDPSDQAGETEQDPGENPDEIEEEDSETDNSGDEEEIQSSLSQDKKWGVPDLTSDAPIFGLDKYQRFECGVCGDRFEEDGEAQDHRNKTGHGDWKIWTEEELEVKA